MSNRSGTKAGQVQFSGLPKTPGSSIKLREQHIIILGVSWISFSPNSSATRPYNFKTTRVSIGPAIGNILADLAGFIRDRRHSRRRPRSDPHDGDSDGPALVGSRSPSTLTRNYKSGCCACVFSERPISSGPSRSSTVTSVIL